MYYAILNYDALGSFPAHVLGRAPLPAHGGVQRLHGQRRRRRVDVAVRVHVGLLRARVGRAVLHARLHVHHLQVVELLLRRHAVPVEPVAADDVRVEVGRHARARRHLHVLHRTQVACNTTNDTFNFIFFFETVQNIISIVVKEMSYALQSKKEDIRPTNAYYCCMFSEDGGYRAQQL